MRLLSQIIQEAEKAQKDKNEATQGKINMVRELLDLAPAQQANRNFLERASMIPQEFIPFMRIFTPVWEKGKEYKKIDWAKTYAAHEKVIREQSLRNKNLLLLGYQTEVINDIVGFMVTGLSDMDQDNVKITRASGGILATYNDQEMPRIISVSIALISNNDPDYDTYIRFRQKYLTKFKASKTFRNSILLLGVNNIIYDARIMDIAYSFSQLQIVGTNIRMFVRSMVAVHGCREKDMGLGACKKFHLNLKYL